MTENKKSVNIYSLINWKIMIPIMLFTIFNSAFNAFSPVLVEIQNAFPDASPTMIQMLLSLPSMVSIPMGLLSGILCSYFYKKDMVLFSIVAMFIGGVLPVFSHSTITAAVIASLLIGVGQGLMINIAIAMTAEFFPGEATGTAMGLKQAAGSIGIAGLTIATGYLARSAWYNAYTVYFLLIPIFLIAVIFVPKGQKDVKIISKGGSTNLKDMLTRNYFWYLFICFAGTVFDFAFYTNIAMCIINRGLGDSAAVGVATAWNSIITIVVGIIFGYVLKAFKRYTFVVSFVLQAAAFLMIANAGSLSIISVAGMIYGLGAGIQMIAGNVYISEAVSRETYSLAISIAMAVISIGVTLSPVVVNGIVSALGMELNGITGMQVVGITFVVLSVLELLYSMFLNRGSQIGK